MFKRIAAVAATAAMLSACVSAPPNPLDTATRQGTYVKDAAVIWSVDDTKRGDNPAYVEGKADVLAKLEAAVEEQFKTSPAGSVPVNFKIDVKSYSRVGAAMGNLIGGSNMVVADVTVVREADGAELGTYKAVTGMYASNGGLIGLAVQAASKPDVPQVMANSFATNLRARFDGK